jgi:hypothetical protein
LAQPVRARPAFANQQNFSNVWTCLPQSDILPIFYQSGRESMGQTAQSNIIRLYIIKLSKWLMLTMPILFLFYQENGLSTQDLFLLKAVYSLSIVLVEIPSGYFGDVWGRKCSLVM